MKMILSFYFSLLIWIQCSNIHVTYALLGSIRRAKLIETKLSYRRKHEEDEIFLMKDYYHRRRRSRHSKVLKQNSIRDQVDVLIDLNSSIDALSLEIVGDRLRRNPNGKAVITWWGLSDRDLDDLYKVHNDNTSSRKHRYRNGMQLQCDIDCDMEDEVWFQNFEQLMMFLDQHGHCNVPDQSTEYALLAKWVRRQRQYYKYIVMEKSSIKKEYIKIIQKRIKLLNKIGFVWDLDERLWENMFQKLKMYKIEHGDCLVPRNYKKDLELGVWVSIQRHQYRKVRRGLIEPSSYILEFIRKLDEIEFMKGSYETPSSKKYNRYTVRQWDTLFEKLVLFKDRFGHCLVPFRHDDDPSLGHWVHFQRVYYKRFINSDSGAWITQDRIDKLNSIGFCWTNIDHSEKWDAKWLRRYGELVEYKILHGDCMVPIRFKENPKLGSWVNKQRKLKKNRDIGKKSALSTERMELLNDIDFVWDGQDFIWNRMYKSLKAYKKVHGDCLIPYNYPPNPKLGKWVSYQRWCNQTDERRKLLNECGFCWSVSSSK